MNQYLPQAEDADKEYASLRQQITTATVFVMPADPAHYQEVIDTVTGASSWIPSDLHRMWRAFQLAQRGLTL